MKTRHPRRDLDVDKVLREFENDEKSNARRNGTFKIDAPFEKGLNTILKGKPEVKRHKKQNE